MPRTRRQTPGGYVYHVLNRACARLALFEKDADYDAFQRVLDEALGRHPIRVLGYCVMPNHWHFVLWPKTDRQVTDFLRWLTHTHTMRWHVHHRTVGTGHLYQGRFKAFPIQEDDHLYSVLRYVERNPLRAGLVARAEDWRWSSLYDRRNGPQPSARLSDWPATMPKGWVGWVNRPQTAAEVEAIRRSVKRGRPYGDETWEQKTVKQLGLEATLRERGRPRKQ